MAKAKARMACAEASNHAPADLEGIVRDPVKEAKKAKLLDFVFDLNTILERKLEKNGPGGRRTTALNAVQAISTKAIIRRRPVRCRSSTGSMASLVLSTHTESWRRLGA